MQTQVYTYKMICKLEAGQVRIGVFKVDDDELLMLILREE